jgi:hypothetical protein
MKALTAEEARSWCEQRSVIADSEGHLSFSNVRRCISIDLPEKPYKLVALANFLLPYSTVDPFRGALLWIRQWGVWDEFVERAGFRVMELLRCTHGETRSLGEAPGYLFEENELVDLQVALIQPLLIGWDAFLVPESGEYIVATSHDETTRITARTSAIHDKVLTDLQSWNPRQGNEWPSR